MVAVILCIIAVPATGLDDLMANAETRSWKHFVPKCTNYDALETYTWS